MLFGGLGYQVYLDGSERGIRCKALGGGIEMFTGNCNRTTITTKKLF